MLPIPFLSSLSCWPPFLIPCVQCWHHPRFPGHCPFRFPPLPVPAASGNITEASQERSGSTPQNPKHEEWNSGLDRTWKYSWKAPVIPQFPQLGYWHVPHLLNFFPSCTLLHNSCSSFTYVNPPAKFEGTWPHKAHHGDLPYLRCCQAGRVPGERQLAEHAWAWCEGFAGVRLSISVPAASPGLLSSTLMAAPDLPSAAL